MLKRLVFCLLLFKSIICFAQTDYKIQITKLSNNSWCILNEDSKPFYVKGLCYSPTPIGRTGWDYQMSNDTNSPWLTDAESFERIGANVIRIYQSADDNSDESKKFIRQLYKLYSIYTLFPLPLTMHDVDFSSPDFRRDVKKQILNKVNDYKDTPGILLWLIGNEVDYSFYDDNINWATANTNILTPFQKIKERANIVFSFIDDLAKEIKKIDKNHPVGISLGKIDFFNLFQTNYKNIDFIGVNYYKELNFSGVWSMAKKNDRPVLITEFGYDAFNNKTHQEDEATQAKVVIKLWNDINNHIYLNNNSFCLGGCVFEYTDEWWKNEDGNPNVHSAEGSWANASWPDFTPDGSFNVQEEWFGICKIEKNTNSNRVDKRIPRQIYYKLKEIWNPQP